jgi:hypothetical protein
MKDDQGAGHKSLEYGVGAIVVLVISVGIAAVVYSVPIIAFDLFNVPAWIFGPFGVYTIIYSLVAGKESTYYLVWGTITFAVALISAFYNIIKPFIIVGILAIVLAVIGLFAYWRSRK